MTDILREVDEAMRVERMTKIWNENKYLIIVGCAALILGTAASAAYNSWTLHKKRETTSAILAAATESKPLEALTKAAEQDRSAYKALALMTAASKAMESKRYAAGLDLYKQVAADRGAPLLFRDLAIVQKVAISLDHAPEFTSEELLAEINKVAANEKSPWIGQGLFTRAIVKAHKGGDIKGAIGDLELVTQKTELPESLRQRAQALIDTYQLKDQS